MTCILIFLYLKTSCPRLVSEVALWWCGEDRLKALLLSSPQHIFLDGFTFLLFTVYETSGEPMEETVNSDHTSLRLLGLSSASSSVDATLCVLKCELDFNHMKSQGQYPLPTVAPYLMCLIICEAGWLGSYSCVWRWRGRGFCFSCPVLWDYITWFDCINKGYQGRILQCRVRSR